MEPVEALIPMTVSVALFATIFGIIYLKSRENMALIERGINPRTGKQQPKPFINLKYGLLLLGSGAGLMMAYIIDVIWLGHKVVMDRGIDAAGNSWSSINDQREPAIYFAMIAVLGGLGLIVSYRIEKKQWLDKQTSVNEG